MKRLAVVSGKGGTGKTVVTGGFAACAARTMRLTMADCDVDAANLALLFDHTVRDSKPYFGMQCAAIDSSLCIECGICAEKCRFGAIHLEEDGYRVDPIECEGCGVCAHVCPAGAVSLRDFRHGEIFYSETGIGPLFHARLTPGSGTTGLLVTEVKQWALEVGGDADLLLIDGPPGIGCPLISTVTGCNAVLAVTEPSMSGLSDLGRLVRVCEGFPVRIFCAINRYDLEEGITAEIAAYCAEQDIPVLGLIPFDPAVPGAVRSRTPVTALDTPAGEAVRGVWERVRSELDLP
ncbi:ATP-binding protein [Methanofollis fontis]|uniref:(4Fe-4S)-binding protein n=1 Tax=Methanofollis fontis TaxID=2052832 RepID=A0A483CRF1_9EURY|nr:ATP-binding protein [Methanofollis fontis]TAJ43901.1 (4Fe-4S)-binding protein [Methanofollis fontis]